MKIRLRLLFTIIITVLSLPVLNARLFALQTPTTSTPVIRSTVPTESTPEVRQKTFEIVWQTVKDKHFDPNFNGVNWDAVRLNYAPLVAAVKSDNELYSVLNKMLGELKQSHFSVIPPSALMTTVDGKEKGDLGLDIRIINGQAVIRKVAAGSSSEQAGLKPGFTILAVDNKTVTDLSAQIALRKERPQMTKLLLSRGVVGLTSGPVGSTSKVRFLDGSGQPHEVSIGRQPPHGQPVKLGNLPTFYEEFETRRLAQGAGYIRFSMFLMPILAPVQAAVKDYKDAPGIIIDLRGNAGGLGYLTSAISGLFFREQVSLGTVKSRTGDNQNTVRPDPAAYTGTLIILTDEMTGSAAEVLSGGLQGLDRAKIVGQRSVGAVLPATTIKLPTGAALLYAIGDFKTSKGVLLEGVGVAPDYEVPLTKEALLAGRDEMLEKAISIIEERRKN